MQHPLDLSPQALGELVHKFNNLPRISSMQNEKRTGIVSNQWIFGVFNIPLGLTPPTKPESDLLLMVNVGSVAHFEGPWPTLGSPTGQAQRQLKAERTAVAMMTAFVKGFEEKHLQIPKTAPWGWATGDERFASEIGETLRRFGVRQDRCDVGVLSDNERTTLATSWRGTQQSMRDRMNEGARVAARR